MWNNKINHKKVVLYYFIITNPQPFQTRLEKVDQHTGGKWLNHGTKRRKGNEL